MTKTICSTSNDTKELSITVYNDHFGVVKETRAIRLTPKVEQVIFMDVAAKIETDSLMLKGIKVHELNYDYDLVSKAKLFEKYLDQTVYLHNKIGEKRACRLLSVHRGMVLEDVETKELYIDPVDEIILPKLPEGLIIKPALVWKVPAQETQSIEVSYITKGMEWKSNYVMELINGYLCQLSGWVELFNQTGTAFTDARLKLIAGDVKRVNRDIKPDPVYMMEDRVYSPSNSSFTEQEFADYHMYKLDRTVTMKNEQTKQIQLFQSQYIPCRLYYECQTNLKKASICILFHNRADHNLGLPLPKGVFKVYQRDEMDGALEFIGEDEIDHTPRNEQVRLVLGEAFDLVCEHAMKNRIKHKGKTVEQHEVILKNHKSTPAEIRLSHYVPHRHWEVSASTHACEKESDSHILFYVEVNADSELKIQFEIEIMVDFSHT